MDHFNIECVFNKESHADERIGWGFVDFDYESLAVKNDGGGIHLEGDDGSVGELGITSANGWKV